MLKYSATLFVNYPDDGDDKSIPIGMMTLGELGAHAENIIKAETSAVSFLIDIVVIDAPTK